MDSKKSGFSCLFYSVILHIVVLGYSILNPLSIFDSKKNIHIQNAIKVDTIGLPDLIKKSHTQKQQQQQAIQNKKLRQAQKLKVKKAKKLRQAQKLKVKKAKKLRQAQHLKAKNLKKLRQAQQLKVKKAKKLKKAQQKALQAVKAKNLKKLKQAQQKALQAVMASQIINKVKQDLTPPTYKGATLSEGNSQTGKKIEDFKMVQYFTSIREHINMYWNLPQELANKNLRAEVFAKIDKEGRIITIKIIKSSNNLNFDAKVQQTIKRASPVPKPTTTKIEQVLLQGVTFRFPD